ncbi:uncharacterized protein DUF1624 [Haloactinospora alba]|uniref:Uncharacterized protein DUF1624 n=1 Tax=Haloactinospora alba TaxID=405555 RepID=A0A543NIP6_9ACTN|nr:heparan-alpha-glucosaminide N-acetyltransferase domain-containing protein [Haloactinospora alba]TQN31715.1 uncharacterized protein DUF1624 [Haloactinospora alba]
MTDRDDLSPIHMGDANSPIAEAERVRPVAHTPPPSPASTSRRFAFPRLFPGYGPGRLLGIDVARGLAIVGMFVVHLGLGTSLGGGSDNPLIPVVSGRAAALFAVLAGVSVALLSGGATPKSGGEMGVALWRVVIRALCMLPVGTLLTMLETGPAIILSYYAVFFVLAVPFMRERWKVVAGTAAVLAVVGPVSSFVLRGMLESGPLAVSVAWINTHDPLVALSGEGIVAFLLTGSYPAVTWMPFVLAGLAIGRLRLGTARVQWVLTAVGTGTAVLAYGGSWLAMAVGGSERLDAAFRSQQAQGYGSEQSLADTLRTELGGTVPTGDWTWLLAAAPHSGTPFEVYGAGGVAIAVLGTCLLAARYLSWLLFPLAALGALALTTYAGHILAIWVADHALLSGTPLAWLTDNLAWSVLLGSLAGTALWRMLLRHGPLEWTLHTVSTVVARRIP